MEPNAEDFIKDIFPVLFVHPSIHLLGLAAFGLSTLSMNSGHKTVLRIITSLILISAFAAFILTAIGPGILMLISASCFLVASYQK